MSDEAEQVALLDANREFYVAFTGLDIEHMARVWAQVDDALCVHPNWKPLHGWPAIRASWERIFANSESMEFVLTNEQPTIEEGGQVAHVDLIENLREPDGGLVGIAARNSFARVDGRWLMTAHVAAPNTPA